MAFRTRRQQRYSQLRNGYGKNMPGLFLPFEARVLSRVPINRVPYMRMVIRERQDMYRKAVAMGTTQKKWEDQIRELYQVSNWLKKNRAGKVMADPWKMFRDHGEKYKARHPEYDSPWEKSQKDWRDFQKKVERTLAKQRLA
jgi:hypothetical protein